MQLQQLRQAGVSGKQKQQQSHVVSKTLENLSLSKHFCFRNKIGLGPVLGTAQQEFWLPDDGFHECCLGTLHFMLRTLGRNSV